MRDKDLYAQILGIKSPWQVSGVELALSEGEVTVHVEQEEGVQHCCPTCGEVSPGYDSRKRVFGLVIDFGTSQSPKSTRPLTTYLCPSRPGHQALRNNFASSLLLRTWLPYDWTPRSEAYFVFPLAQGTLGKQCGLAATGVYQPSLRSPWLAAYAEAYCRISSYLQTMANQGYNPLVAIQMAFSGQLYADRGE
ncbi:hypothetical protein [Thiolapillus sp.]|uniref:hypothetical protein n=1 Tax=Thiolapillus sp. TaxID=2017437 RepID=UPI003AF9196A